MPIIAMALGDSPPLARRTILRFDSRVNLFVGPNSSGKTTILREIAGSRLVQPISCESRISSYFSDIDYWRAHPEEEQDMEHISEEEDDDLPAGIHEHIEYPSNCLFVSRDWPGFDPDDPEGFDLDDPGPGFISTNSDILYIPATRISLRRRLPSDQSTSNFDAEPDVFDGRYVQQEIDRIIAGEGQFDDGYVETFREAIQIGHSCAQSICSEIIREENPRTYAEHIRSWQDESGRIIDERSYHYAMGIGTKDVLGEHLYAGDLSAGMQSTLLWIYALVIKMVTHHWMDGWVGTRLVGPDWQKRPTVLLIDEIENHLHPTWQRRVIPALLEHFPGLQIFATTHSPFVVAGLKTGQVHLLKRDEGGRVTPTPNTEDIIGWTADEILRTMMGVDDPTDDATAAAARELRQLRQEAPRASSEEETQRQNRMQELRRLVDRDLLAGGPWKAQRELFEQRFAESLRKYQVSHDLNQEGA